VLADPARTALAVLLNGLAALASSAEAMLVWLAVFVRCEWTPIWSSWYGFFRLLEICCSNCSRIVSRRNNIAGKLSFVIYFGGFCCIGHLTGSVVPEFWGDGVECLCVLPRTQLQFSLSPPFLRYIYVHDKPCHELWLECVPVLLGLLRM